MENIENMELVKIDRNGSKHYEGPVTCDRCGGDGVYKWGAVINGRPQYVGVCFKCNGVGKVHGKVIVRTPEYQAKLDAKREAKWAKLDAERAAKAAEREAEQARKQAEREARLKALRALSQHVGKVGDKFDACVTYTHCAQFEVPSFRGFGTDTKYIHTFKDDAGNVLVWKTTQSLCGIDAGAAVRLTGRIKEHGEYREEKQTVLTRCSVYPSHVEEDILTEPTYRSAYDGDYSSSSPWDAPGMSPSDFI